MDVSAKMPCLHGCGSVRLFTPRDKGRELKTLPGEDVTLLPQHGEDLGQKMKNAIGAVLRLGYDKVVLMGMDIPHIHTETIQNAFDNLDHKDIVIHPAVDGSYYLIRMKQEYESIRHKLGNNHSREQKK